MEVVGSSVIPSANCISSYELPDVAVGGHSALTSDQCLGSACSGL